VRGTLFVSIPSRGDITERKTPAIRAVPDGDPAVAHPDAAAP
jgi:hypothetical protein